MDLSIIIPHIEALVFASEKPLTSLDLVELVNNALGFIEDRASLDQIESAVDAIKEKYNSEFSKALSAEKVNTFFRSERDFGNEIRKELQERRMNRQLRRQ